MILARERGWFIYETSADGNKAGRNYFKIGILHDKGGKK
jgi:hypothetical protein